VNTEKLEALRARAQRDIDQGIVPSCQIALARENEIVHFETFGDATDDSRYVIFSATKAVTAGAIWQLIGEGELDVRTRVAEIVPEFGSNGKDAVTVEHVLTHTGGFPTAPLGPPDWGDREARLRRFADWRVTFEPGSTYVYHPTSGHWVLGEIIHRLRGDDYREVIRKRVLDPLGLVRLQVGVPVEDQGDIATLEVRGEPASPDELEAAASCPPPRSPTTPCCSSTTPRTAPSACPAAGACPTPPASRSTTRLFSTTDRASGIPRCCAT
jgi:CubicO group peptidase (beta-lactamase class C family)